MAESSPVFRETKKLKKGIVSVYKPAPSTAAPHPSALPRRQQFSQALGITAASAAVITPDTTAVRQTFLRQVCDFPPNARVLGKPTSHRETATRPVSSVTSSDKGAAGSLQQSSERGGGVFSSCSPAPLGQRRREARSLLEQCDAAEPHGST